MRTLSKYLLIITTTGWTCTFIALINQFTAYQQLTTQIRALRGEILSPNHLNTKNQPTQEEDIAFQKRNKIYDNGIQGVDFMDLKTTTTQLPHTSLPLEVLKSLSSTLLDLQNNVMEIQYFLRRRRKDWSPSEKSFMDDLVKYLWNQVHDSRDLLTENHCPKALEATSEKILHHIKEVLSVQNQAINFLVKVSNESSINWVIFKPLPNSAIFLKTSKHP